MEKKKVRKRLCPGYIRGVGLCRQKKPGGVGRGCAKNFRIAGTHTHTRHGMHCVETHSLPPCGGDLILCVSALRDLIQLLATLQHDKCQHRVVSFVLLRRRDWPRSGLIGAEAMHGMCVGYHRLF